MLNNPTEHGDGRKPDRGLARRGNGGERLHDREVPLGQFQMMPTALHEWLDGDAPESATLAESTGRVEFWSSLQSEAVRRRAIRAPARLQQRIMGALSKTTPLSVVPWHRRPVELNIAVALSAAAGLVALGTAIGIALAR